MKNLLLIVGMMVAAEMAARACDCAEPPPAAESLRKATAVFAGQVTSVKPDEPTKSTVATFAVQRAWKGVAGKEAVVFTTRASCGFAFREGEAYLVYAHQRNDRLTTTICTRTKPVGQAEAEMKELDGLLQKTEQSPLRTESMPVLRQAAPEGLIGVGIVWEKNIFVQEYWMDGKCLYVIANKTNADQSVVVFDRHGKDRLAGPWQVKAHSLIRVDAAGLAGKDLVRFSLEDGTVLGLLMSPVQPANLPQAPVVSFYGLNGSGGRSQDVWVEQRRLTFPEGVTIPLQFRIPGSKGELIVKKGDLSDLEVVCDSLAAVPGKDQTVLNIAAPLKPQDVHIVTVKFKAPKVEKPTMLTVDTWLWERGKQGGHAIARGIVVEPCVPRAE